MPKPINHVAIGALAVAIAGAGPAGAETLVRIQNDSVHPSNMTLDKRSRDIRSRKAGSFPIVGTTGTLTIIFANGEVSRGELDVSEAYPTEPDAEGNQYYCVNVDSEGLAVQQQADCQAALDKTKKK